jgi:hypothetical protein
VAPISPPFSALLTLPLLSRSSSPLLPTQAIAPDPTLALARRRCSGAASLVRGAPKPFLGLQIDFEKVQWLVYKTSDVGPIRTIHNPDQTVGICLRRGHAGYLPGFVR